ncbi:MAG: FecR domain-containing protein [Chitinophagaceae bacterium]|nr:FecR domain-containing protein [Chitinophagaceae bacterium]
MEEKEFYQFLLERYANGTASDEEVKELFAELEKRKDDHEWEEMISQYILSTAKDEQYNETHWHPMIQGIISTHKVRKMNWKRWLAAASVIVMASAAIYLFYPTGKQENNTTSASNEVKDIAPGKQGAILTMADHSQVLLDTVRDGAVLALEGGARASVINGRIVYDAKGSDMVYNTISTPKGRQYRVTIPDGTNIWLNSGSSVRYPTAFTGNERVVAITGEAYLEVAKDAKRPFRVTLQNNHSIQVLGTSFNVNAYEDEPFTRATLLEGAVNVQSGGQWQKLLPGQQAQMSMNEKIKVVDVSPDQVIAWKNGLFDFTGKDLPSVLREIARWYDLDVVYESEPGTTGIVGKMQRSLALSQVMETLKDLDIHYRIEGRKLIISK